MVDTAHNMNGARDSSQISRWTRPNLIIFLYVESVCDDQQNTEVYGTNPPHPQDLTIWPYRPPAWAYGLIARLEGAVQLKQVGGNEK